MFTRSGTPIPLDSCGREMCLLFIKYGRCRFKHKCKKSHWTPPLPDEEYTKPPPLPLSPPPSLSVSDTSTEAQHANHGIFMAHEQRQKVPAFETSNNQNKCAVQLEKKNEHWRPSASRWSNSQAFSDACQTSNQEGQEISSLMQTSEETQLLFHHPLPGYIQNGSDPTMIQACTGFVDMKTDAEINTEKECFQGLENQFQGSKTIHPILTGETKESAVDRISHVIYKRRCRFDFVYGPNRQDKGAGWKLQSSNDQSYAKYGAYYDHVKNKLEFHHQPRNKAEKKNLKFLRRAHWNTCQELRARLAQLPPGYSLKVDFTRVNFSRLRPYFYLLVHQCLFYEDQNDKGWKPTPFSCLVAETLIALFVSGNVTPAEAETKMRDWGGKPVRVRHCISHMWNIIVKSSLSASGVATEVLNCERQVFAKKLSAVDYAFACTLAGPVVKGNQSNLGNNPTPTITKSVRQGFQAAKQASLLQAKRALLKSPGVFGNVSSRTQGGTIEAASRTIASNGVKNSRGMSFKQKKRKTKRSKQFSLLDERGKQELLKRCKTVLAEENM